ncbi:MAG TPA: PP0621 family protein [Nitrosospira sp.]|nr:PP0621 family protein [Nitrosospira sp.]
MGRLLFFALIAVLAFWVIRSYRRALKKRQEEAHREPSSLEGEDMVRCLHCGVHLPRSESITSEGNFFCSDEHRRLHLEP